MLFLTLSIISSVVILIIFKVSERYDIPVILPIIINYFVASAFGFLNAGLDLEAIKSIPLQWIWPAAIVGSVFVLSFILIGLSTRKAGIAITTIAAKMSFVFPMFFSIFIDSHDGFNSTKLIILIMAVAAVFLTVVKKRKKTIESTFIMLIPFMIFILLGLADSLIKYAQNEFVTNQNESSTFTFVVFGFSALWGAMLLGVQKSRKTILKPKVLITGILLGIANFGSLFFFINALNNMRLNNSIVIALNNTGTVLLSVIVALFVFREQLSKLNKVGIGLSILTFVVLMYFL